MRLVSNQKQIKPFPSKISSTLALAVLLTAPSLFAANGTWTNAPVDSTWTNIYNWVGLVVPGQVNNTGNNGIDTSVATFNSPIFSGIGGAANPIVPDDATVVNGKARMMGQLNFTGASCGAYVFYSPSPFAAQTASTPETGVLSLCCPTGAGINGSYIGTAVVNPQVFLVPVQIRLPSSTTGTYGFTNNAASVNATYYFSSLFEYPAATGRGVTFVFAGSNTGTNTVNLLSQSANQSGSPSGVRKEGTGRWILAGANVFNSGSAMNINDGTLEVKDSAAFGSAANVNVNSSGVLQVDGVTLSVLNFNLNQSGTIRLNGSATINGVTVSAAPGTTPTVATTSGTDVLSLGNAVNMVTGGTVDSVLHVTGPGTVQLGYANNYAGTWSLDAGTLQLASGASGALGSGASVHIGAGATLDLAPITSGGGTYNPATAGISASGAGTTVGSSAATIMADAAGTIDLATGSKTVSLDFAPTSFTGDSAHPALYVSQGTLSLGGNSFAVNNTTGTPLGVGTYQLILQAGGSIVSSGGLSLTGVTGSGLAAGTVGNIVVNGSEVDLVVSSYTPKNLVWKGGNPNSDWDINSTLNFLNGGSPSVFNNSDNATFNSTGVANPNVNILATVAPGSVTVDTSAGDYTFGGSGSIAGATGLTKAGTGTLSVQTVNTYGGNTVISNGVLQLGVNEAIPSPVVAGAGKVDVKAAGTLDLNGFNNTINALTGSGTVDSVSGGSPVLTVGNNNDDGTFAGTIKNTAGTLNLTKAGTGVETLTGINTYSGSTTVQAGSLRIASSQSLPAGNAVVVNGGILDLGDNVTVSTLAGTSAGIIANNSTSNTNTLTVGDASAVAYSGKIVDNSGAGGKVALHKVGSGSLQLGGASTYTGGTLLSEGTLELYNGGTVGPGLLTLDGTASEVTLYQNGTGLANTVTVTNIGTNMLEFRATTYPSFTLVGGGQVKLNLINYGLFTPSGDWSGFSGTVVFTTTAGARANINPFGSSQAVWDLGAVGNLFHRYAGQTINLGALTGQPGAVLDTARFVVGGLNTDTTYSGAIVNTASLVKVGTGRLTLNGGTYEDVTLDENFNLVTNNIYTNLVSYTGSTTISNGVLAVAAPASLTNSSAITLASSTAVLDASQMGTIDSTGTNLVVNGLFEIYPGQTLAGLGTIRASSVLLNAGSTLNVGLPTGVLTATNTVELAGAVTINLLRTSTPNSGKLAAPNFTIDSTATLVVTNAGPALVNGDHFTLFNQAVNTSLFASVTLPATDPTGTTNYVWQNDLAVDGTITLTSGGVSPINTNPPPIISSFNGTILSLSWPTNAGWVLQMQTNNLSNGLGTNWVDVPGSTSITSTNITVDPASPTVFYRLKLP